MEQDQQTALPTINLEEAIIAATLERISLTMNGRPWLDVLTEWQQGGEQQPSDEMHQVFKQLCVELDHYLAGKAILELSNEGLTDLAGLH